MASGHILREVKDGIATVTLNRPEKLNAFSGTMAAELYASFAEYDKDDDVRVIVVTGAGRAFSAGADLSGGGNTFDADARAERRDRPAPAIRPWNVRKPIIAAINGPAVGMGITLPMQWDIRVAAESARIGFVFVRRGVIPEALSLWTVAADDRPGQGQRTADDRTDHHRARGAGVRHRQPRVARRGVHAQGARDGAGYRG